MTEPLLEFASRTFADSNLVAQATAAYQCLFDDTDESNPCNATIAHAEAAFGDNAHLLRGLMVVDSIRRVRERHAARGCTGCHYTGHP